MWRGWSGQGPPAGLFLKVSQTAFGEVEPCWNGWGAREGVMGMGMGGGD